MPIELTMKFFLRRMTCDADFKGTKTSNVWRATPTKKELSVNEKKVAGRSFKYILSSNLTADDINQKLGTHYKLLVSFNKMY